MRRLKRNQKAFTYKLFLREENTVDDNGFYDGGHEKIYADPVETKGCIVYTGSSDQKAYGLDANFSLAIIPDKPIENIAVGTIITIGTEEYVVKSAPTTMNEQRLFCK